MGRWTALSDYDYYDEWQRAGVEFHCAECDESVWIAPDAPYPGPRVYCQTCAETRSRLAKWKQRIAAKAQLQRAKQAK